ncbi:hypothetical protein OF829_12785 [Sphingomonas sp. LB-2]|uniref:hypothetical protein n=1 Tax=Sphingomonas caeni TaxID=2984949 RepID=UPI00222E24BB|nr:hypothetical protein [Sphingomonas caeni]MCW3848119.1 hypothetical protein [Sphingomonas caeni]
MAIIASADQDPITGARQKGGGKLSRSETVTVRLDPKLNYLCELAARAQRRTKSSFIEWAIENALKSVEVPGTEDFNGLRNIDSLSGDLWDVDEADRVAALAFGARYLMTHDEQLIWKLVTSNGALWRGHYDAKDGTWKWHTLPTSLIPDRLREHWDVLKGVALGQRSKDDLPTWQRVRPGFGSGGFGDDLSDDVPF